MKDEIVELQVYIFTWLCIYFCMFFFFLSVQFELGGVAVVHCLPKREKKEKKKTCSVSEFTNISGTVELNNTPWNLLYPLKKNDYHFICKHA